MLKLVFGLVICFVVLSLCGVGFGFWKAYEIMDAWLWWSSVSIYLLLFIAMVLSIIGAFRYVKHWLKSEVSRIVEYLKGLTPMQILKIILGIIKK